MYQLAAGKKTREETAMRDAFTSDKGKGVRSAARKNVKYIPAPPRTQRRGLSLKSSWRGECSYPSPSATGGY